MSKKDPAEKVVRDIRRKTRRKHSTEEKIRIVLEGLRGEDPRAAHRPRLAARGMGFGPAPGPRVRSYRDAEQAGERSDRLGMAPAEAARDRGGHLGQGGRCRGVDLRQLDALSVLPYPAQGCDT